MKARIDPEGARLPIKLDTTSNGEFLPVPLSRVNTHANRLAHEAATQNAKRLGLSRRDFLVSACGAASTCSRSTRHARSGRTGGFFDFRRGRLEQRRGRGVGGKGDSYRVQSLRRSERRVDRHRTSGGLNWSPKAACGWSKPGPQSSVCLGPLNS